MKPLACNHCKAVSSQTVRLQNLNGGRYCQACFWFKKLEVKQASRRGAVRGNEKGKRA